MTRALLTNNALTTLAAAMAIGDTTFSVVAAAGFPGVTTASGNYFYGTLVDGAGIPEIVKVTNITGNTFTCTRAQDNTAARTFASGAAVSLRLTAAVLAELQDMASKDASNGYAGLTGFALNVWHAAKTFKSMLSFSGTANRSHALPDKDGTVAMTSDITDERAAAATLTNKTLTSPVINAIDGTPIGQLTPEKVTATTLSSTGKTMLAGATESNANVVIGAPGITTNIAMSVFLNGTSHAANGTAIIGFRNGVPAWFLGDTSAALGFGTGSIDYIYGLNSKYIYTNGAKRAEFSAAGLDVTGELSSTGAIKPGSYTLATRPAQAAGKMIYVSDGGAGAVFQGSNGGAWVNLG